MDGGGEHVPVSLQVYHLPYSLQVILAAACMSTSFSSSRFISPLDPGLKQRRIDDSASEQMERRLLSLQSLTYEEHMSLS